jgi:hypothetical protein
MEASLAVRENTPHGRDQSIEFYRLAVELVAPRGERLFAFAGERMCGESDDWNVDPETRDAWTPRIRFE